MTLGDLTREQEEDIRIEARSRTRINYDNYLNFLFEKYLDTNSGRVRTNVTVDIIRTFERMVNENYSPACMKYYSTRWALTKEKKK